MLIDLQLEMSDAQAVTTTSALSTGSVDLGNCDAGVGEPSQFLEIVVDETVTSGGAATVQFTLQTDSDSAFGSATDIWVSAAIAKATLVAGYVVVRMRLPIGMERYARVKYDTATALLTAGKFSARIVPSVPQNTAYADNITI